VNTISDSNVEMSTNFGNLVSKLESLEDLGLRDLPTKWLKFEHKEIQSYG